MIHRAIEGQKPIFLDMDPLVGFTHIIEKMNDLSVPLVDWLLEESDPSVRYRTLTELLHKPSDGVQVQAARKAIMDGQQAQRIFKKMHPDGYWLQKKSSTGQLIGDGVEYGSFATTHFVLSYLAELGFTVQDPRVAKAADRYLNLQQADGDFWMHLSCLYSYNIRTFIMLGLRDDARVQRAVDMMLATAREDGGYLCDLHEGKYKTRDVKSCIRGSVKALLAFAELPEYWQHPRCLQLIDYFLQRGGVFKRGKPDQPVNDDIVRTSYPIIWRASITELLYGLAKMGYGNDQRLSPAWDILESKRDTDGRYILDWTTTSALLKAGKRGEPNKWVTLYALLAKQFRDNDSLNRAL